MSKVDNKPNYTLRRTVAGTLAVGLGAAAWAGFNKVENRVAEQHATVPVPVDGGMYKTFHLNEEFTVDGKKVTVANLSDASVLAELPDVDSRATLKMLESQLPDGVDSTEVTGDMTFKLPMNAHIGDVHTGE